MNLFDRNFIDELIHTKYGMESVIVVWDSYKKSINPEWSGTKSILECFTLKSYYTNCTIYHSKKYIN